MSAKKATTRKTTKKSTKKTSSRARSKTTKKTTRKKTTKKAAAKKISSSSIEYDEDKRAKVSAIVELMVVDCLDEHALRDRINDEDLDELIEAARARLGEALKLDKAAEYGASIARMKVVFAVAKRAADATAMIQAQKEISRLLALYPDNETKTSTDQGASSHDAEELEAIGEHLLPLGLASRDYPLSGHARIAADRLRALESKPE